MYRAQEILIAIRDKDTLFLSCPHVDSMLCEGSAKSLTAV
jgi:hypothetical protein